MDETRRDAARALTGPPAGAGVSGAWTRRLSGWLMARAYALRVMGRLDYGLVALAAAATFFGVVVLAEELIGRQAAAGATALLLGVAVFLLLSQADAAYRLRRWRRANEFRQTQALVGLHSTLRIRGPLPAMRGYAASPDFGLLLASIIRAKEPRTIVELGSGVSSIILGYAIETIGNGAACVSLEHDAEYLRASARSIEEHGLAGLVRVAHAPLTDVPVNGRRQPWYDPAALAGVGPIDVLVVDGPPGHVGRQARYPALPLLIGKLSPDAVVIVDDYRKPDERRMVQRWLEEFPRFALEEIDTEKGAAVLRRAHGTSWEGDGGR